MEQLLDDDERLLWKRLPGGGPRRRRLRAVQLAGHVLLTSISVLFAVYTPLSTAHRFFLGALLIVSTNLPLVVWSFYRLPQISSGGDAFFFLTDQRVGLIRPDGELRQAPICPGLNVKVNVNASLIEFSLGERTPVIFGGLRKEDILLVSSVTEGLIAKCE